MSTRALPAPAGAAPSGRKSELGLAIAVVFVIALLVLPLPPFMLDLLLAASIGSSLVVLLVALYSAEPLEFSSFPSLLLILTLFRLALNVSSTRLILTDGHAGKVIQAFGEFVIGGNYAVGVVIFLILVAINFIVITKGAGRVAEVAARFTLDAMPGKQMAIDADLGAGLIDESEARRRREDIARQAEFYGAMDGSSKFVKGDAVAGLLITAINIVGGIFIGVVQRGMPATEALATFTMLTVGDGLVTQIPALVLSTAAGLMVTHTSGGTHMGVALGRQLSAHPRALWIVAAVLLAFSFMPGLPMLPFLALAGAAALMARGAEAQHRRAAEAAAVQVAAEESAALPRPAATTVQELVQVDPVEVDVGYALIPLVDERQGGELMERIGLLRRQAALELGILVPPVRIRDDVRLPANEYVVKLRGTEVARGEVMPRFLMALDTGGVARQVEGMDAVDPSFGMPARWISGNRRVEAESYGYVVVEPATVMATHLMETLKGNAAELLGRQEVREMVDALARTHPALVEEVVPAKVSLGTLHRVLQRLLRERVPVRDLVTVLEAVGDAAEQSRDPEHLTEFVRRALGNVIARQHTDGTGALTAITVGPRMEQALTALFTPRAGQAPSALLNPDVLAELLRRLHAAATTRGGDGRPLPLLVPPALRVGVRRLVEPVFPQQAVISLAELPPAATLHAAATWELDDAA